MDYEVDLQTRFVGKELETLWVSLLQYLTFHFNTIPVEERKVRHDERVDGWCKEFAAQYKLTYYRNDNWLCFCDKELAPN